MKEDIDKWEEVSEWYDEKQGEQGDLWHRALIDPVLKSLETFLEIKFLT